MDNFHWNNTSDLKQICDTINELNSVNNYTDLYCLYAETINKKEYFERTHTSVKVCNNN